MERKVANKDLRRNPHDSKKQPRFWWYEEPSGILVFHEVVDNKGNYLRCSSFNISWKSIRSALKRKDKK